MPSLRSENKPFTCRASLCGVALLVALLGCSSASSGSAGGAGGKAGTQHDGAAGLSMSGSGGTSSMGTGGTAGAAGTSASGGSGGSGGLALTQTSCAKDRPFQKNAEVLPDVRKTISGSNGTFTDECDSKGNLTEYGCEGTQLCSGGVNPSCQPGPETGKVVPQSFDCNGHCKDGACPSRCPEPGDLIHFESIGGPSGHEITVRNLTDDRRFTCEAPGGPDFTCEAASLVGRDVGVLLSGAVCTGAFGVLTLDIKRECGVPNCSYCSYASCHVL